MLALFWLSRREPLANPFKADAANPAPSLLMREGDQP
jgi:hypothetical protein